MFASTFPNTARYAAECFAADQSVGAYPDDRVAALLEPVVAMWEGEDAPLPPSHAVIAPLPPQVKPICHRNVELATGFTPSFLFLSYAIYDEEGRDRAMCAKLAGAHHPMMGDPGFKTFIAEGNFPRTGAASSFTDAAFKDAQDCVHLMDPAGLFATFQAVRVCHASAGPPANYPTGKLHSLWRRVRGLSAALFRFEYTGRRKGGNLRQGH